MYAPPQKVTSFGYQKFQHALQRQRSQGYLQIALCVDHYHFLHLQTWMSSSALPFEMFRFHLFANIYIYKLVILLKMTFEVLLVSVLIMPLANERGIL